MGCFSRSCCARKTGKGRGTVARDVTRGKQGREYLPQIVGTSLNKGAEIDALAKLPEDERNKVIAAAREGEKVSAKVPAGQLERREMQARMQQDVGAGSALEAERLRARVEEVENKSHRLEMETRGLRSQLDEQWDEMKSHIGADADNAPLWSRLHHLLGAALAACERKANWPPLNPDQQQRRAKAIEDLRVVMSELLALASPAKHRGALQ